MLIVKLSGLLRRLLRSQEHFVTLREELAAVDEYLDIERVRFGPSLVVEKEIDEASLDVDRAQHDPAAARRELDQARPVAQGRRGPHHDPLHAARRPRRDRGRRQRRRHARATGSKPTSRARHRPAQRQRAAARDLRRELRSCKLHSVPGQGTSARIEIPELAGVRAGHAHDRCAPAPRPGRRRRAARAGGAVLSARPARRRRHRRPGRRRRRGAAAGRRAQAGPAVPRRPDARPDRVRSGAPAD